VATKKDLLAKIAEQTGLSLNKANEAFVAVFDAIGNVLTSKDSIQIAGFGSFKTKERKARVGRNPKTGEAINIPASIIADFKLSSNLKNRLNIE